MFVHVIHEIMKFILFRCILAYKVNELMSFYSIKMLAALLIYLGFF